METERQGFTGKDEDGNDTVTFKAEDITTFGVLNYDGNEFMAAISGYGLSIAFNMRLINSVADAEAMANAIADVFYNELMNQIIAQKKELLKPPNQQ